MPKNDSFNIWFNIALPKIQIKILFNSKYTLAIQFNSQEIIDTRRIGEVPKNYPKSVEIRPKRGLFIKKMGNIDSKYDSFFHFTIKFNSKDYSIIFFQEYSIQKIVQKPFFLENSIQKLVQ